MHVQSVLAWTDGSVAGDSAVDRAAEVAAGAGAALTVAPAPFTRGTLRQRLLPRLARRVRQLARQYGVPFPPPAPGPASWSEARAMAAAADLVVLPAPWRSGWSRLWRPGLLDRLLRHTDSPLLVVRQPSSLAWGRATAAVDLSSRSSLLLAFAAGLRTGARFELLHVLPEAPPRRARSGSGSGSGVATTDFAIRRPLLARAPASAAATGLEHLVSLAQASGLPARPLLVHGRRGGPGGAREAILERQQESQARLLMLGHARRPSVGGAVLGSIASAVAHRAACDVLVVPDAWLDRWAGVAAPVATAASEGFAPSRAAMAAGR
ncbi:MAG: universal stress protein [Rubrivivax sp.]